MTTSIPTEIIERKGATKLALIPNDVLDLLNEGKIASVNLMECLAIDHVVLMKSVFPNLGIFANTMEKIQAHLQVQTSSIKKMKTIGTVLAQYYVDTPEYMPLLNRLVTHLSDTIRSYACYFISENPTLSLPQKLHLLKPLVADTHFGVREIAWMAIRPALSEELNLAVSILSEWAEDSNENIRRFCSEALRPRGVWCQHIDVLKQQPEVALTILEKLKNDPSKYVRDSVGNWLNDASKTSPSFVQTLCHQWQKESPTKATAYIVKKGLRSLMQY